MLRPTNLVVAALLLVAGSAAAYPGQDDESFGYTEMQYSQRGSFTMRIDGMYFDGEIRTSPPDSVKLDERLQSLAKVEADIMVHPKFSVRPWAKAMSMVRTEQDEEEPKTYVDETEHQLEPGVTGTYSHDNNMDFFAGGSVVVVPKHYRLTTSVRGKSKRQYNTAYVFVPHLGFAKKFGNYGGGLFFTGKGDKKRKFIDTHFDGTETDGEEHVFRPMTLGVFGQTKFGSSHQFYGELVSVQAGDGGEEDTTGKSVGDDHFIVRFKMTFSLTSLWSLCPGVSYQTLGYSDQSYMTFDNIPVTILTLDGKAGSGDNYTIIGFAYARGSDKQSLPEFNTDYAFNAFTMRLGYRIEF